MTSMHHACRNESSQFECKNLLIWNCAYNEYISLMQSSCSLSDVGYTFCRLWFYQFFNFKKYFRSLNNISASRIIDDTLVVLLQHGQLNITFKVILLRRIFFYKSYRFKITSFIIIFINNSVSGYLVDMLHSKYLISSF